MVGAEGASPQPTSPLAASTRTSRFSALAMVMPAIVIGAFSGNATGMASMRRTINGAASAVEPSVARGVRSNMLYFSLRMILSENRFPLFGIMRVSLPA